MDTAQIYILLLEDSDLDADLLQARLQRAQVPHILKRVWTQDDFEAALTSQECFDLILADYVLPNFDGMQALELAHHYCPDTPFIFVSGTLGEEVAIESLKRGATDYVTKQRLDRLPSAVRRAFDEAREKTARKHAEQQLRDINASLSEAVAARTQERDVMWRVSQDLFVICHPDGTIRNTNPAWQDILGWDEPSLHEVRLAALVEESDRPSVQSALIQLNERTVVRDVDLRMRARGGPSRHFSWTFVRTDEGPFYGAGRDISYRMDLEAQLRQVQKMESIGQLTGGVAHDFNNLLTIVQGNLDILRQSQDEATPPRQRTALDNAMRGADRGAKLTASLLAFSRRQPLSPQVVDVNELVSRLAILLGRTLGEQVQLQVELAPDAWPTYVDPNQLENALINLAVNARDAMRAGGTLTLRTENRSLDAAYCKMHSDKVPGDYVGLSVVDNGPGMPEDVVARAFDPFFTTKDESKGTGLGLSQVYGFAKQSGGHARIDSTPDQGTAVLISLPRHVAAADDAANDAAAAQSHHASTANSDMVATAAAAHIETILVVEDDPDVRMLSTHALSEMGYQVLEAGDGPTALDILSGHPEICLLFTDIGLPFGMNGRQLAERAKAMRPELPVLFTSAYAASALVSNGRLERGVELLSKPFSVPDLSQRVRQILDRRPVRRVLLVEDDEMIRQLNVELLETHGYDVVQAASLGEARRQIANEAFGHVDMAIIDLGLPDGSGGQLVPSLRARRPALPILILSGDIDSGQAGMSADMPDILYLAKPYRSDDLLQVVSNNITG